MTLYKVIAIPDETRVIVNYGIKNSLQEKELIIGTEIHIVEEGFELFDPDTNKKIGYYNPIKEKLEITEIYDAFCIARKKIRKKEPSLPRVISPMLLNNTKTKISYQSLNVNDKDNKNCILKNNKISIGDLVVIN